MKNTIILTANELQKAALEYFQTQPQFSRKHVGAVHLIADPDEPKEELRIRAMLIVFDTALAAREYGNGNTNATDKPQDQPGESNAESSQ